jgi:hypothetical protein
MGEILVTEPLGLITILNRTMPPISFCLNSRGYFGATLYTSLRRFGEFCAQAIEIDVRRTKIAIPQNTVEALRGLRVKREAVG